MERQIKFRGKDAVTGEWVVGDLLHIARGCLIYFGSHTDTVESDIEKSNPIAVEFFKDEIAVVDPDTVGQYTGVDDVNGNPIFEGDIVETFSVYLAYQQIGNYPPPNIEVEEWDVKRSVDVVKFSDGSFDINGLPIMFEDKMCDGEEVDKSFERREFEEMWEDNSYGIRDEYPYLTWDYFCKPHIIGNIHDNPSLMSDKQ